VDGVISRTVFNGGTIWYEVDIAAGESFDVRVENIPSIRRWDVGDPVVVDFHPEAGIALSND
jgi:hypothetical protein